MSSLRERAIPWNLRPFRERSDGFSPSWPFQKFDPYGHNGHICMDRSCKPIKEQTLCQYSLQMRPELSTEGLDERQKAEGDC